MLLYFRFSFIFPDMTNQIALGMMSGTSIDGAISVAIVDTDGEDQIKRLYEGEYRYEETGGVRPVHHLLKAAEVAFRKARGDYSQASAAYPGALQEYVAATFRLSDKEAVASKIRELSLAFWSGNSRTVELADVIQHSTKNHEEAAQFALKESGISPQSVSFVGYHGQTLYHDPFINKVTVQVGDAQTLANSLRIPVVFDFRTNDVKHGGQGAPLAPVYHRALVRRAGLSSAAILNLGGTANVTVVGTREDSVMGFDTGPANGLLDRYVKERTGGAFDENSRLALSGMVNERALAALVQRSIVLADGRNFLDIPPPKSLDIRDYTLDVPELLSLSVEDGCATLNAFTAECVALGTRWIQQAGWEIPATWILCGGGVRSPHMREQLRARLSRCITGALVFKSADEVGWSSSGMEAELFAYLAVRSSKGLPITFPGTTGAPQPLSGGRLFRPS